jgi:hypothetical protein
MAQGTPYIIDFILDSPKNFKDMNIEGVTDVVTCLYKSRVRTQLSTSLSEGMEFYYRASFLSWLVRTSSPEQRALTKKLLRHIMQTKEVPFGVVCCNKEK